MNEAGGGGHRGLSGGVPAGRSCQSLAELKLEKQKDARAIEVEIQRTQAELRGLLGESAKMRDDLRGLTDLRNTLRGQTEEGNAELCKAWLDRSRDAF